MVQQEQVALPIGLAHRHLASVRGAVMEQHHANAFHPHRGEVRLGRNSIRSSERRQ